MPPRARISQLSSRSVVAVTLTLPLRFYFRSISFPQFQLTSVYFPLSTLQPFWFQKRGFLPHAPCADAPVVLWIIFIFKCSVHDTIHSKSILALTHLFQVGKENPICWSLKGPSQFAGWMDSLLLAWCNWTASLICLRLSTCSEQTRDHSQFLWYQHNAWKQAAACSSQRPWYHQ